MEREEGGGADPDLALALALSISAQQENLQEDLQEEQRVISKYFDSHAEPVVKKEVVQEREVNEEWVGEQTVKKKLAQFQMVKKEAFKEQVVKKEAVKEQEAALMWLPRLASSPVKKRGGRGRKKGPVGPTVLQSRGEEERERLLGERVAAVLVTEGRPATPPPPLAPTVRGREGAARYWSRPARLDTLASPSLVAPCLQPYIEQRATPVLPAPAPPAPAPTSFLSLSKAWLSLLESGAGSDTTVVCKDEAEVRCHSLVLRYPSLQRPLPPTFPPGPAAPRCWPGRSRSPPAPALGTSWYSASSPPPQSVSCSATSTGESSRRPAWTAGSCWSR